MIYKHNGSIITDIGGKWLSHTDTPVPPVDPYNPLGLPANTFRVKFSSGYTPSMGNTQTLVDSTNNIWDIYYLSDVWRYMFMNCTDLLEVLGANTTNITNMADMFEGCSSLTSVPLFDTSSVTTMEAMFQTCTNLTSVPLLDTSSVTNMNYMFFRCTNVQSGALALYQQASTQTNPPTDHNLTFKNCGSNTTSGAAELAQIPSDWK